MPDEDRATVQSNPFLPLADPFQASSGSNDKGIIKADKFTKMALTNFAHCGIMAVSVISTVRIKRNPVPFSSVR